MSPGDDTIILSSEGVLEFVSPEEASLLVQHFSPTRLQALRQAYMQESVPGPEADASSIRQQPIDTLVSAHMVGNLIGSCVQSCRCWACGAASPSCNL